MFTHNSLAKGSGATISPNRHSLQSHEFYRDCHCSIVQRVTIHTDFPVNT